MQYYRASEQNSSIICILCRHYCHIQEEKVGICGINKNENSVLKNLVYDHPAALNLDPIEKKPLYHFLPAATALSFGTLGCNFKCPFCQNWQISQEHTVDTQTIITPQQMVALAVQKEAEVIAYTYNEPTVFYPYAKDVGTLAQEKGLKNIFVTNGFESVEVIHDMGSWVDAANVDLKSWDASYYKKVLKGGLDAVKDTLVKMKEQNIWLEVTTLLIEGENDSNSDIQEMATFIATHLGNDTPWHLSAFHPDFKMHNHTTTSLQTLQRAQTIAHEAELRYVYLGNVAAPSDTYCPQCNTLLIKRKGYHVVQNRIQDSSCPNCGSHIKGVWK